MKTLGKVVSLLVDVLFIAALFVLPGGFLVLALWTAGRMRKCK